jgi:hypothetical protein
MQSDNSLRRALEIAHLPSTRLPSIHERTMLWIAIERLVGPHDHVVVPTLKPERAAI